VRETIEAFPMPTKHSTRIAGLDTLRAVAIVSVMMFHFCWRMPAELNSFSTFGWMGVDLFFVLSGYLIGSQLLKSVAAGDGVNLGRFYRARAYRILPAYLVVLGLYAFVPVWRESAGLSPLWEFLTFTENLFVDYSKNQAFSHVWSLCVEEHFYLLLPLMVIWLAKRPSVKKTASVMALLLLLGVAVRSFALAHTLRRVGVDSDDFGHLYIERIYYPTWARLDGLLAGVGLALIRIFRPQVWERIVRRGNALAIAGAAVVGFCVWLFEDRFSSVSGAAAISTVIGFPLLSFGLAMLVASAAAPGAWLQRTRVPGAEMTATLAFSLYLSHKGVTKLCFVYLPGVAEAHSWLTVFLFFASWFAAATLLYYGVERPFLKLRDRHKDRVFVSADVEPRVEPAL
jgi:peptidoglycan/LPS O-acetylase OafA/YrhL